MDKLLTGRSYDSLCGNGIAFDYVAEFLYEHTNPDNIANVKVAVVSDREVSGYYFGQFEKQFLDRGIAPALIPVESRNAGKSLSSVEKIYRYLIDFNFSSNDWIIGLGGGGIIDIAGFACSIFYGGINFLAVPTTLHSMIECGSSRASFLNCASHKDVIRSGYLPEVVICDPSFIQTVPAKVKSNGYASIIKYAILAAPELLDECLDIKDYRVFLNGVFAAKTKAETVNPLLIEFGEELALAIEGYFRFMNYSEGEALALSIYSAVSSSGRKRLKPIYDMLHLPCVLGGVSKQMILKTLRDQIYRRYGKTVIMVDCDSNGVGQWVVKKLSIDDCMKIYDQRIDYICEKHD